MITLQSHVNFFLSAPPYFLPALYKQGQKSFLSLPCSSFSICTPHYHLRKLECVLRFEIQILCSNYYII